MSYLNNKIYLRRRYKIALPPGEANGETLPVEYIASVVKNVETYGYGFGAALIDACRTLSLDQLTVLYRDLISQLKQGKGADKAYRPFYPNFPRQVMEASRAELYLNAIIHYWSSGQLFPAYETEDRSPLPDTNPLQKIDLGTQEDFESLFAQIVGSNTSLSEQDKADVTWFVTTYRNEIVPLLPESVPQKETVAFLADLLIRHTDNSAAYLTRFCRTATDVLRLAVMQSGGDVSLAESTKFRTFTRSERRLYLALLEAIPESTEDMLRWKSRWIRLGEKLHPGEFATRFPKSAKAFAVLRNDEPFTTFNGVVESALAEHDVTSALAKLSTRGGDLARRLDHLLRLETDTQDAVVTGFAKVTSGISTPVLLQVRHHFALRPTPSELRVFFPKGMLAKAHAELNTLPALPTEICRGVVSACETALVDRFRELPSLGRVFVAPELKNYMVPFAMRSASKSLRTLVRGSRLPIPGGDVLRFFIWWKNGKERTDIDLSAVLLNEQFAHVDVLSYYNLTGFGGCHSGDIVDAPNGASEFIDVTLSKVLKAGVRYIVMSVNSYSQQPFVELPECFAGWMNRQEPNSGEIYEPKTVYNKLDLTADTKIAIPVVFDVVERRAIWCDMALRRHPNFRNNVAGNLQGIAATVRSLVEIAKPNLYDLLYLHAVARGEPVGTRENAETIFSVENDTPFRLEEIASQYML